MEWLRSEIKVKARHHGLHEITEHVAEELERLDITDGMVTLYLQHTTAGLCISESFDTSTVHDLEAFLENLAPKGESNNHHAAEGEDISATNKRAVVTGVSLSIPIENGRMMLGTYQGVFLCEHRRQPIERTLLLRVLTI